jgi:Na+/H+ antiporter NhaD/arsenite permease-like protein
MSTHAAHRPKSPLDRFVAWFAIAGTVAVAILSVVGFASHAGHEAVPKAEAADIAELEPPFVDPAEGETAAAPATSHGEHGSSPAAPPPMWWLGTIPFVALILAIAVLPLVPRTAHWWEANLHRLAVAIGLAFLTLAYYVWVGGAGVAIAAVEHAIPGEYVPFIVLLFSLYVISGGIAILGDFRPSPLVNTTFLAIGTAIASAVGTTGASMLLIWPLLRTLAKRRHRVHTVIFFIFLVANVGGTLLPTGDPPLFLGYLRGVPFLWTLSLWGEWLATSSALLIAYFIWDTLAWRREDVEVRAWRPSGGGFRIVGGLNLLWLALVVLLVATVQEGKPFPFAGFTAFPFLRELLMLACVGLSLATTPREARETNRFNYTAILEVACLFVGIFITMQVPLEVLKASGGELGLSSPAQFFWFTGVLSSFLDNAPTYLVFFQTAETLTHEPGAGILQLLGGEYVREDLLTGVSIGAVFMGAMTYIGNGPNFMVRSIAEQSGIRMPSFFGYMLYSAAILLPLMIVLTLVFL